MKRAILAAGLALSLLSPARAQRSVPEVKQWQLANGLKVLLVEDHKAPVVTVQIFYHAGSKDEPPNKRGIAHMFEHMMFKGSRHVAPEEHARFIDAVGGNENAFTEEDNTGYYDNVPPGALDFTFKLEAERMRNLELTQKTVDSEREVVKEEHRVSLENNPVTKAFDRVLHLAYKVHPYRELAIGEPKMLDTVTVEDCKQFYDIYYRPNNATLIVVGDTDQATVKRLANRYFGPLERGPEPEHPRLEEPPQSEMRQATLNIPIQLPVMIGAYHIPPASDGDIFALEVLQQILSAGESSRLYQRLVRKDKSAVAAAGFVFRTEDPGLFLTFAAYLPGSDSARVKSGLEDEIEQVTNKAVSAQELAKARNQLAARAVYRRERVAEIGSEMGRDGVIAHDPLRAFTAPARYDAVTAGDVLRVAKKYLIKSNYSLVTLVPKGAGS